MIITVESPSGKRTWRLEPFDNGLCWRLMKTPTDPKAKSKWINCESYHATLDGALKDMVERMLCDPDDPCTLPFKAEDVQKQAVRTIKAWLKEAKVKTDEPDSDSE